ncbi:MAG: hypothetical protein P8188_16145 [Gemmatimonadota bacterium]
MRFIYIDSQDREVNIPSVDAVRLRIELGAIKDHTRFYDDNTGKWAPASEHDIYRTLKRQLQEAEHGFVMPPPPPATRDDAPSSRSTEEDRPAPGDPDREGDAEDARESDPLGLGVELELAPSHEPASGGIEPVDRAGPPEEDLVSDPWDVEGWDEPEEEADRAAEDEDPAGSLEAQADPSPGETREDFIASAEDELMGEWAGEADTGSPPVGEAGLALEPGLADSFDSGSRSPDPQADPVAATPDPPGGADPYAEAGGVQREVRGHAEEASWDGAGGRASWDDSGEAESWDRPGEAASVGAGQRDVPPSRPRPNRGPPQRKLTRARTPGADRIVGIVGLVVVLGAGAFFGWPYVGSLFGGGWVEAEVVMPPLDPELVPRMRQLASRASSRMAADMEKLPERAAITGEPSRDWLAGVYLANASAYADLPRYWNAVQGWVAAARAAENALFREALQAQLDTANLAASDSEAIRDRALAGFQAAGSDRRIVYNQLQQVAERSLNLHGFLLANEDRITHEPAGSGISRDPVREAVPATEELGEEMWTQVGSITSALDALGYLERIETEALLGVFLEKLEATAIR